MSDWKVFVSGGRLWGFHSERVPDSATSIKRIYAVAWTQGRRSTTTRRGDRVYFLRMFEGLGTGSGCVGDEARLRAGRLFEQGALWFAMMIL